MHIETVGSCSGTLEVACAKDMTLRGSSGSRIAGPPSLQLRHYAIRAAHTVLCVIATLSRSMRSALIATVITLVMV